EVAVEFSAAQQASCMLYAWWTPRCSMNGRIKVNADARANAGLSQVSDAAVNWHLPASFGPKFWPMMPGGNVLCLAWYSCIARPSCLRLFRHMVLRADS